jgi:hypothetical protein
MSQFGGNQWMQGLAGLFGQQQGFGGQQQAPFGQVGHSRPAGYSPYQMPSFMQQSVPSGFDTMGGLFGGGFQHDRNVQQMYSNLMSGGQPQQQQPTVGQTLAGLVGRDYQATEAARQQELAAQMGILANLFGAQQGAGQMVMGARGAGDRNMQMMQDQAGRMREAAAGGQQYFDLARRQMESSLGEARRGFEQGIQTSRDIASGYDAAFRGDTAAEVMGIQQQYKNQMDQIARRDDLTREQKDMMTSELRQGAQQQSAGLAAQANARARDSMAALQGNIAQMQAMSAGQMGQFGIGVGQALGQLGAQTTAMRQQAEEQIGNFYNNMAQFNSSLVQNAQATALQYMLQGNQLAAGIVQNAPFGPVSLFGMFANMARSVGAERGEPVGALGNLVSRYV